mmetsp:Transcript_10072/g.24453  ORF Transcript_10072/g.24453 Transcript_10072/m.24453 type:complete len:81 (-) Transcript_10072:7-249(-)
MRGKANIDKECFCTFVIFCEKISVQFVMVLSHTQSSLLHGTCVRRFNMATVSLQKIGRFCCLWKIEDLNEILADNGAGNV